VACHRVVVKEELGAANMETACEHLGGVTFEVAGAVERLVVPVSLSWGASIRRWTRTNNNTGKALDHR